MTALARCRRSASTCRISMNGSDIVDAIVTIRSRSAAAAITPEASAAADGSAMSCTINPTVRGGAADDRPRIGVGGVVELGGGRPHPGPQLRADRPAGPTVQRPGRGGQRHAGPAGDIGQRDLLRHWLDPSGCERLVGGSRLVAPARPEPSVSAAAGDAAPRVESTFRRNSTRSSENSTQLGRPGAKVGRSMGRRSVGWLLVLVLALDTSTPSVTAGVVRLRDRTRSSRRCRATAAGRIAAPAEAGRPPAAPANAAMRPAELLAERSVDNAFAHAERLMPLAREALAPPGSACRSCAPSSSGSAPDRSPGCGSGSRPRRRWATGWTFRCTGCPAMTAPRGRWRHCPANLLVVTDARRREVYLSGYRADGGRVLGPLVVAPAAGTRLCWPRTVSPPAISTGAGAGLLEPQRSPGVRPGSRWIAAGVDQPRAGRAGRDARC